MANHETQEEAVELNDDQKAEAKEVAKDVSKYQEIAHVASMPGGKILIDGALESVVSIIEAVIASYKQSPAELISLAAQLDANYTLLKTLTNSSENSAGAAARLARLLRGLPGEPDE